MNRVPSPRPPLSAHMRPRCASSTIPLRTASLGTVGKRALMNMAKRAGEDELALGERTRFLAAD